METDLLPLIDGQTDPTIATYAKEGECSLRIASKRPTLDEAKDAVDEMTAKVAEIVGEYIYSYDNEELVDVVHNHIPLDQYHEFLDTILSEYQFQKDQMFRC